MTATASTKTHKLTRANLVEGPSACYANLTRKTSTLHFADMTHAEFQMRGGILWPRRYGTDQPKVTGFAVLLGLDIHTKILYVFESNEFSCIDHVVGEEGVIEFTGLSSWINKCWQRYFARDFFWHQDEETHKKYRLQVSRSKMIEPKPRFTEVHWQQDEQALQCLWEQSTLQRLFWEEGTELDRQADTQGTSFQKETLPAVHALMTAVTGFSRFPYRIKNEDNSSYER